MAAEMTPDTAPEPVQRTAWQRWVAFWFPASDPTTLGFVRITTGLLVLYIHLAYSVDLQQFFGKQGWYSAQFVDRERREYPWQATPFIDWDMQSVIPAKVPDFPHRRQAVVGWIRSLPPEESRRKDSLRFLDRCARTDNPDLAVLALRWFQNMGQSEEVREHYLAVLTAGPTATPARENAFYYNSTPPILLSLSQPERDQLADEVRAFWAVMPKDATARAYVLNHLLEVAHEVRRSLVQFLMTLPVNEAERNKKIDYLDYWNNEPEKAIRTGHNIFSVWFHVTDPTQMAVIHVCILLTILLFTFGLFTRVTSVLVWLAVVGYIHRTQQVLFGMDTMMNILLFYLMIGNSGAALSLDRLIARYRSSTWPPGSRSSRAGRGGTGRRPGT